MKKTLFSFLLMLMASFTAQADVDINTTNFPDVNFRNYMLSLYPEGYMTTEQVNTLTELDVRNRNIQSLQGVELLTGLKAMDCSNNIIVSLDLRNNAELTSLSCSNNNLYTLNVSSNNNLTSLNCSANKLTTLRIIGLSKLEDFDCHDNQIKSIDWPTASTSGLKTIDCSGNAFTSLVLNNYHDLTSLVARNNTSLGSVNCSCNALTTLDLTGCTGMKQLWCYLNYNLSGITGLADLTGLTLFVLNDCAFCSLDVSPFTRMTFLNCSNNQLTTLDLSAQTALQKLYCYRNNLRSLNVTGKTQLQILHCYDNQLLALYLQGCSSLNDLRCYNNSITEISNLADCTALTSIDCHNNSINDLSAVGQMTDIRSINASSNYLESFSLSNKNSLYNLNLMECPYLTTIWVYNNPVLGSLICNSCPLLTELYCVKNDLSTLDVSGCDALNNITCTHNRFSGEGMTTLVNSLPRRTASEPGSLYVLDRYDETNTITDDQILIAQRKHWQSKKFNGYMWETMMVVLPGDMDGNGEITISDVSDLIDLILSGNATASAYPAADVNGDGQINIVDVSELIDALLNKQV